MAVRVRRDTPEPRLEMTPLVDVLFLLLTFFVVAMVLMVRVDLLEVSLPGLEAGQQAASGSTITVTLDSDGALFVDGRSVDDVNLVETVRSRRQDDPDATLLIAADVVGSRADLIALMDTLAQAGLSPFSLVGQRQTEE